MQDGNGLVIRLFNPTQSTQKATLSFSREIKSASWCGMGESDLKPLKMVGHKLPLTVEAKKIYTVRVL